MDYPSKLVERAVEEVAKLPGIGKKTALRLILHLIEEKEEATQALTDSLHQLRKNILFCVCCGNISDEEKCLICKSHKRDRGLLCVVEDTRDVLAIENTGQYTGLYHVLGGVISPINGVGPSELKINALVARITDVGCEIKEVILALSPTIEGDTTALYLSKKLKTLPVKVSTVARGIPIGSSLEFADEITLGRSILARTSLP